MTGVQYLPQVRKERTMIFIPFPVTTVLIDEALALIAALRRQWSTILAEALAVVRC